MASPLRTVGLHPPIGGIQRRHSLQNQEPYTTPDARNCWGCDYTVAQTGRDRIATRPGLTATGGSFGTPLNWCEATWLNGGTLFRGVAIVTDGGTYVSTDGASFTEWITTAPGTDFATCAVYLQKLYMARGGGTTLFRDLTTSAGAGAALSTVTTAGTAPTNCGLVCSHADRLWLGGDTANPHVLYAAKIATPTDWDFSVVNDRSAAWASTAATGGQIGEPIVSLTSHTEDCLIIGCVASLWVQRGNPQDTGPKRVSHYVGPLMQSATCHDGTGAFWFVSPDGLYKMSNACGGPASSISRESLPDEFVALNPATSGTYCALSFDPRFRCLWLFVDQSGSGSDYFWSYDLQNGGWFTHTFGNGPLRLGVTLKGAATTEKSALLAINASGTVYQFDRDSTESFSSYVWYGPIQLGSAGSEGILHAVQASVATDSDAVSWTLHVGDTAEEAFASSAAFTGDDWPAGLSTWQHCRRRGAFAYFKISGTTTDRWAVENIDAKINALGLRRAS
jgi:hypothetical protein